MTVERFDKWLSENYKHDTGCGKEICGAVRGETGESVR